MLNSNNSSESCNWGSEHFWNDAKLLLYIERPGETMDEEIFGAKEVSEKLRFLVLGLMVFFHPNVNNNGIKGDMNRHGLLIVKSAGTLHKTGSVVGLFEQAFGLIKDPHSLGNWKIKNTELRMKLSPEPYQLQNNSHSAIAPS